MKININLDPRKIGELNRIKIYNLGTVTSTLQDLLDSAEITIEDNLLPVLLIDDKRYLIPDLQINYKNLAKRNVINILETDLIEIGGSSGGESGSGLPYEIITFRMSQTYVETSSGSLEVGKTYYIDYLEVGDDFSNVGYVSDGVSFVATGTTPTTWTNGTYVVNYTDSIPTGVVLAGSISGATFTFGYTYATGPTIVSNVSTFVSGGFLTNGAVSPVRVDDQTLKLSASNFTDLVLELHVYNLA